MVKKEKIACYREKLDRSLASHDLTDDKKLETLVKDQILRSAESTSKDVGYSNHVIAKRTAEVSNLIGMMRSASENYDGSPHTIQQPSWKLKQDTEELRVMYREGPEGSPFHSLLAEGYVNAALDVCLCVSWESELYTRWFPETLIPTFKVVVAKRLQKVRIGEEISLVRVKLSWPLSSREAILHYFEFEYLQDGLVLVLLNTISDVEKIEMETHGFTNEGIPEAENTVRIDLVGGFALQKVTENRSYFRTIANMDIKLDFVPPSLINFISRQLIGSGFRLYQKIVASVSTGDESFAKALSDPLYRRIREALFSDSETQENLEKEITQEPKAVSEDKNLVLQKDDVEVLPSNHANKSSTECESRCNEIEEEETKGNQHIVREKVLGNMFKVEDQKVMNNGHVNGYLVQYDAATEIEEEGTKEGENVEDTVEGGDGINRPYSENVHKKVPLSPQVERALSTLDRMITVVREGRLKVQGGDKSVLGVERDHEAGCSTPEKHWKLAEKDNDLTEELVKAATHAPNPNICIGDLRKISQDSHLQEANNDPKLPIQKPTTINWSRSSPSAANSPVSASSMTRKANGIHENNMNQNKKSGHQRKWRLCCLHLISNKYVS